MSDVTIFAPSPILTVTVEDHPAGSEIHIHAGGQGVWQARMLLRLGVSVTMCCVLSGETGTVLRHLLEEEGITVTETRRDARGAAYIHDRRDGQRAVIAEEHGEPLGRHDLDEVYGAVLREGLGSRLVLLSGPGDEETLPADTYRRLAADLRAAGTTVMVDLAGERLAASLDGGIDVLKVSDEELRADGLITEGCASEVMRAMRELRTRGVGTVIVTREAEPALLLDDDGFLEATMKRLEVADTRGAGDSLTAGVAAGIVRGESARDALTLGAAAGAMNVTRHGLGTGDPQTVRALREMVTVRSVTDSPDPQPEQPSTEHVTPGTLASMVDTSADQALDADRAEGTA